MSFLFSVDKINHLLGASKITTANATRTSLPACLRKEPISVEGKHLLIKIQFVETGSERTTSKKFLLPSCLK